jgi:hypothetical protein
MSSEEHIARFLDLRSREQCDANTGVGPHQRLTVSASHVIIDWVASIDCCHALIIAVTNQRMRQSSS